MHPNPRKVAPVFILVLVIAGAAWWYFNNGRAAAENGALNASGTIETTQVILAPEVGGHVTEVAVGEGDSVKAGQPLVYFDDAVLKAQLAQAEAALQTAQANYDLVAAGPNEEQQGAAIAKAELDLTTAQQALKTLNEKADLASSQAAKAVADGKYQVDRAESRVDSLKKPASQTDIDIASSAVTLSDTAIERAQRALKQYLRMPKSNPRRAAAELAVALLEQQHDQYVKRLNYLEGTPTDLDIERAQADLALARSNLEDAKRHEQEVKAGPDPDELVLANARIKAAEAQLALAKAGPSPEQLEVARAQVAAAKAAIDVIQAQMQKLVLLAPADGLVLTRSVERGEVVLPGSPLMTLGDLGSLKITVYVPEDRYGTLSLGQTAAVQVDSFPGRAFNAVVVRIADQAEFTPRNVQTEEGRRTMVFAVELAVQEMQGLLKPGMPADVSFEE